MSLDVRWHPSAVDADVALAEHVTSVLGEGVVSTGRQCPRCGSAQHGRPWARLEDRWVPLSLARSGPHLLTVVGTSGAVGVDVESVGAVSAHWDPQLVLAPGEEAWTRVDRARAWARKEAVLKAYGVGLALPAEVTHLGVFPGEVTDLPAPDGYVAAAAELTAGPEGPARTTRRRRDRPAMTLRHARSGR